MFHIASSKGPPAIPEHLSAECKDFLYLCFNRQWKARPSAARLLEHPFLVGVAVPVGLEPAVVTSMQQQSQQQQQQQQQPLGAAAGASDVKVRAEHDAPLGQQGPAKLACSSCIVPLPTRLPVQQPSQTSHTSQRSTAPAGSPGPASDESDGVPLHTPSPMIPKLAAAVPAGVTGGAARISLAASDQHTPSEVAAPSPHPPPGQPASRRQLDGPAPANAAPAGRRLASPSKRSIVSVRASAPVLTGYAALALSQQLEPLTGPRPTTSRVAAAAVSRPMPMLSALGSSGSKDSCVNFEARSMAGAAAEEEGQLEASSSSSGAEACPSRALVYDAPAALAPADIAEGLYVLPEPQHSHQQQQQEEAGDGSGQTPAPQRRAVQDLIQFATDSPEVAAGAEAGEAGQQQALCAGPTPSTGDSGNSGKSAGYNPMEEPTWMQAGVSPLEALSHDEPAAAAAVDDGDLSSGIDSAEAAATPPAAAAEGCPSQEISVRPSLVEEHWVWTNDDGDIDALPWDVGNWNASNSREQELEQPQQQRATEPVGQEQIMSALSHKVGTRTWAGGGSSGCGGVGWAACTATGAMLCAPPLACPLPPHLLSQFC